MCKPDIAEYLGYIPRETLERDLLSLEEDILHRVKGDIYALETCFRFMVRNVVRHGTIPDELPVRLTSTMWSKRGGMRRGATVEPGAFRAIVRKVGEALRGLATARMCIKPVAKVVFRDDPDLERARREKIYSGQVEKLEKVISRWERGGNGPYARAVLCLSSGQRFPSARQAAEWASQQTGRTVKRSDIRTALVRGCRCAGHSWAYDRNSTPELRPSGAAVRCVEMNRTFESRAKAAEFAGVTKRKFREALKSDGRVESCSGVLTFSTEPAPVKAKRGPKARMPGLFDGVLAEAG